MILASIAVLGAAALGYALHGAAVVAAAYLSGYDEGRSAGLHRAHLLAAARAAALFDTAQREEVPRIAMVHEHQAHGAASVRDAIRELK